MNNFRSFFFAGVMLAATFPAAQSEILQDWQFNDGAGIGLPGVTNIGTGFAAWDANVGDSFTTANGAYRIQRAIPNNQYAHASIWDQRPVMWLVFDLDGWAFSTKEGGFNEELHLGFSNETNQQYAEVFFGRAATQNTIEIRGRAVLVGAGAEWIPPVQTGLSNEENLPVRLVLKLDRSSFDPDEHSYSIYYNIDGAGYVHVGSGAVDAGRAPNNIRIRALNSFADRLDPADANSPREFVDISRIFLTTEDPIGTDLIAAPVPELPEPKIVADWQFNDGEGKRLGETVNSAGGASWVPYTLSPTDDIGDSLTTADGAFRIQRAVGSGQTTNMMHYLDRIWAGKQWFVADFRGWNLVGPASEQIQFGFLSSHQVNPTAYAQFKLRRYTDATKPAHIEVADPDTWYLSGEIFGASNGGAGIPDQAIFPANQTEPVRIVLEVDETEKTYAIYYRIGDGDYILFGESTTDPNLGPNALRFSVLNSFSDEGDFVDVERIFLTTINPMLPVEGGYAGWAEDNFPGGGPNATAGADPDGDGVENLLEYAFGGNPAAANREVLPSTIVGENYLKIQLTRNPDANDLTYSVKASADLMDWTEIASASDGGAFVASGSAGIVVEGNNVTVSDSEPATGDRRFLKVDVSLTNP